VSSRAPHTASPPAPGSYRHAVVIVLPVVVALFYALGHLNWYLGTPLGRVPVLDERENMDLANAIFSGTLPAEPFYRAPGYALVLAGLRFAGVQPSGLFAGSLLLGVALHAVGAGLVAALARRWFGPVAAMAAGLLFALDPVLVHFATQALDSTFSLTLFLAGFVFLAAAIADRDRPWSWGCAGFFWACAALVRPNYLLVWVTAPLLAAGRAGTWATRARRLLAASTGLLLFVMASFWQHAETGHAGFMPWQGAYNLWAANRPGANGRYYTQHVSLSPELARANPARAESVLLYADETRGAPATIALMNQHWRQRFVEQVTHHPLAWAHLLVRKAYALLNNWEQYNNKTFAFHKALSPWLSWNPICWGFLFVLAVAGFFRLAAQAPQTAAALAEVSIAVAASIILFFVSARFRLPLVALCAVLAGGAIASPLFWRPWGPAARLALGITAALAAFITFSTFGGVDDRATFVQDHVLLARAAFTVGDDQTALREANEALLLQPQHPDALAIIQAARAELKGKGDAQ
jgi:Dolichyl-phosphate-mannose-protein mannosyltransferase